MLLSTGEQVSVALMAMAVDSLGYKAMSLTGGQIGIVTDARTPRPGFGRSPPIGMRKLLDDGNIVIAAGFQGIDEHHDITTLGRGGSDTTAVALGRGAEGRPARSTPTWTASTRPIRACCPRPAASPGSATTKCSNWPAWAPA